MGALGVGGPLALDLACCIRNKEIGYDTPKRADADPQVVGLIHRTCANALHLAPAASTVSPKVCKSTREIETQRQRHWGREREGERASRRLERSAGGGVGNASKWI